MGIPYQRQDGGSLYYRETNGIQHPLWTVEKNNLAGQKTTNVFSSFSTLYDVNDNLSCIPFWFQHLLRERILRNE